VKRSKKKVEVFPQGWGVRGEKGVCNEMAEKSLKRKDPGTANSVSDPARKGGERPQEKAPDDVSARRRRAKSKASRFPREKGDLQGKRGRRGRRRDWSVPPNQKPTKQKRRGLGSKRGGGKVIEARKPEKIDKGKVNRPPFEDSFSIKEAGGEGENPS